MIEGRNILRWYKRDCPLSMNINRTCNINNTSNFLSKKEKMGLSEFKII
jgi:hypothetical protein